MAMQQSSLLSYASSSSSASSDADTSSTSRSRSRTPSVPPGLVVYPDPADGRPSPVSREERRRLVNLGPYQPRLARYPSHEHGGQKRSFQAKWFDLPEAKEWLEYSPRIDAMYCFTCRMFGSPGTAEENWISKGVRAANWKNAARRIRDHAVSQHHHHSTVALNSFLHDNPIDCQLNHQREIELSRRQIEIHHNREILSRILGIIKYLAKQNIPFRGHDESSTSSNRGNFLELVHLQARYDDVLKQHLLTAPRNSMYLSGDIQNQLIQAMGDEVLLTIIEQVRDARFFSLLIDETSDISRQEQVSFVLRYINKDCAIQERFIGMVTVSHTDSATLVSTIEEVLSRHNLSIKDIRGQGYDGASNMSGQYSGVQSRIAAENSTAVYVHCHGHVLNLVLVDTCSKNPITKNFFGTIEALYVFFQASTKRHALFVQTQGELHLEKTVTLKHLSDTRWACRVDSLKALNKSFPAIIKSLEKIIDGETDGKTTCEAVGLLTIICSFQFVFAFVVLLDLLLHTKALSDYLQQDDLDFVSAIDMVQSLISLIKDKRSNSCFDDYYAKAQSKCHDLQITEQEFPPLKRRRISSRIDSAPNTQHQYQTSKDQYRVEFYFSTLDIMTSALENRFDKATCSVLRSFSALHPQKLSNDNSSSIAQLGEFYKGDLDSVSLMAEFELFRRHSEFRGCKSILEVLKVLNQRQLIHAYPNVTCLYKLCLTLPVTTASTERSFSKLKLVKTVLRSTMIEQRLSALLLLSIERDLTDQVNFDNVIDAFALSRPRRLLF